MASIGPSNITLYKSVPITPGLHPIYNSWQSQLEDFNRFAAFNLNQTLYIDGNKGYVDIAALTSQDNGLYYCNYLRFINPYFENKTFICRITGFQKLATGVDRIMFEVDAFQTFQFDFRMRSSQIERQHMSEPQWQRAVANPWRSDIQELTTDEGVSINSGDEVSYWDPRFTAGDGVSNSGFKGLKATHGGSLDSGDDGVMGGSIMVSLCRSVSLYNRLPGYPRWMIELFSNNNTQNVYYHLMNLFLNMTANIGFDVGIMSTDNSPGMQRTLTALGVTGKTSIQLKKEDFVKYMTGDKQTTVSDVVSFYTVPFWLFTAAYPGVSDSAMEFRLDRGTKNPAMYILRDYNEIEGYGTVRDPKLRRAPYRYVRVTSPRGDDIELKVEDWNGNAPAFTMDGSFATGPELHMYPRNYKGQNTAYNDGIAFADYVEHDWATGDFDTYVRAKRDALILGDTANAKRARDLTQPSLNVGDGLGFINGVGSMLKAIKSGFSMKTLTDPEQVQLDATDDLFNRMEMQQAYSGEMMGNNGLNNGEGDAYGGVYSHQRSAVVGKGSYHAAKNNSIKMINLYDSFEFTYVTLQPYIIKGLDELFTNYGYRCDYFGIPRVYDYIHSLNESPHWASNDGMTFTYCKTVNAQVFGLQKWANEEIAGIFNGGARFTRGLQ